MNVNMTKSDLLAWCEAHNVDIPPNATTAQLRELHHQENARINNDGSIHGDISEHSVHDPPSEGQHSDDLSIPPAGQGDGNNAGLLAEQEAEIEAEIRVLEKRKKLIELRRELALLEGPSVNTKPMPPKFKDIKHSVPYFSGDDAYDATKWIKAFERACESVHGDDLFRLQSVKRLMVAGSTAETFLIVDESATYEEFRRNFLGNFGHSYSVSDVIDRMRKTPFSSAKTSVMGYILKMQELPSRADIDKKQTIQFIIDGFRDKSANIAVLYSVRTIDELKTLAHLRASVFDELKSNLFVVMNSLNHFSFSSFGDLSKFAMNGSS